MLFAEPVLHIVYTTAPLFQALIKFADDTTIVGLVSEEDEVVYLPDVYLTEVENLKVEEVWL